MLIPVVRIQRGNLNNLKSRRFSKQNTSKLFPISALLFITNTDDITLVFSPTSCYFFVCSLLHCSSQLNILLPPQPCNVQKEQLFVHGIIEGILGCGELGVVRHRLRVLLLVMLFGASVLRMWQMTHCSWLDRVAMVGERRGAVVGERRGAMGVGQMQVR